MNVVAAYHVFVCTLFPHTHTHTQVTEIVTLPNMELLETEMSCRIKEGMPA